MKRDDEEVVGEEMTWYGWKDDDIEGWVCGL